MRANTKSLHYRAFAFTYRVFNEDGEVPTEVHAATYFLRVLILFPLQYTVYAVLMTVSLLITVAMNAALIPLGVGTATLRGVTPFYVTIAGERIRVAHVVIPMEITFVFSLFGGMHGFIASLFLNASLLCFVVFGEPKRLPP